MKTLGLIVATSLCWWRYDYWTAFTLYWGLAALMTCISEGAVLVASTLRRDSAENDAKIADLREQLSRKADRE